MTENALRWFYVILFCISANLICATINYHFLKVADNPWFGLMAGGSGLAIFALAVWIWKPKL